MQAVKNLGSLTIPDPSTPTIKDYMRLYKFKKSSLVFTYKLH